MLALYNMADSSLTLVATYEYDPWGKLLAIRNAVGTDITASPDTAGVNPLRYRGYYYDDETGFYYLQSRYYDPAIGRFINADGYASTGQGFVGYNMFAYCNNNPIVAADYNGKWLNFLIGAVVGAVVNAVVTAVDSYITTGSIDWADVGVSAATGAVTGAIAASGMGAIAQAGWTVAASAGGDLLQQGVDICQGQRESVDVGEIVDAGATGFATSVVGSAVGNIASKNTMDVGQALVDKGRGNALTGMLRKSVGQSHSSLIRNGSKLVSQGTKLVNRARGICSVVGTLATWRLNASFAARH